MSTNKTKLTSKILVVEDDELSQIYISHVLREKNYQFDIASTGLEALKFIESNSYQLILMDIGLPDTTGIELTTKIRDQGKTLSSIPIVAVTAHQQYSVKKECLEAGMNDVTTKPVSSDQLQKIAERYL